MELALNLILGSLCIGLLLLYLQQLSTVTQLRAEVAEHSQKAAALAKNLQTCADAYMEALRAANRGYNDRVEQTGTVGDENEEMKSRQDVLDAHRRATEAMVKTIRDIQKSVASRADGVDGFAAE